MARPRRLRAQIDEALVSAERLCVGYLARHCQQFPLNSQEYTERLVELIEALATAMVLHQKEMGSEERLILELGDRFVGCQLEKLKDQGFKFATAKGLRAFFLLQLFERLRQEVDPSIKEPFERRANAAYFTPISLSYYMVQSAFAASGVDVCNSVPDNLRLLDLCAGSGALSIAALDYLAASFNCEPLTLLQRHIFAVEIDPLILRSFIACLSVACSSKICDTMAAASANFVVSDCLTDHIAPCDVLLANPPWSGTSYLQFVRRAAELLAPGGVAALLTPFGIAGDQGASEMRFELFTNYHWLSFEGFINEDRAFDIHPSYKYGLSVFSKLHRLGQGEANLDDQRQTRVRFGSLATTVANVDLAQAAQKAWYSFSFNLVRSLSPGSSAIVECDCDSDFELFKSVVENNSFLHKLHPDGQMQMDRGRYLQVRANSESNLVTNLATNAAIGSASKFSLRFARNYDMSIDKKLFVQSSEAKANGFKSDCYGRLLLGRWRKRSTEQSKQFGELSNSSLIISQDQTSYIERDRVEECLLPLIEGRMLGQFEITSKAYIRGNGRQALWHERELMNFAQASLAPASLAPAILSPQYFVSESNFCQRQNGNDSTRIGFVSVSAATNTRSMIAALLPNYPAGNSVPFLELTAFSSSQKSYWAMIMIAVLNSISFDFVLRTRFGGNNLNYFLLDHCSVPASLLPGLQQEQAAPLLNLIAQISALLTLTHLSLVGIVSNYLDNRCQPAGLFVSELAQLEGESWASGTLRLPLASRRRLRALLDALVARLYGLTSGQFAQILSGCLEPKKTDQGPARVLHRTGFHRIDKQLPFEERLPYRAYQFLQDIEMNRLDLDGLAQFGFSRAEGANGQGGVVGTAAVEQDEERLSEHLAWLKLHQTRLHPFHQKSGVK
ncbi:hypothetical protein BH11CYA1_BH11CYA1_40820 [soil metagenome]